MRTTTNNLLNSYISTVTTDRKSPPQKNPQSTSSNPKEPPKNLSKSFKRQLAKTLATPAKKNQARKKQLAANERRGINRKMPKRAATDSNVKASSNKKVKTAALPDMEKDKEGHPYWEISGKRRLHLSEFKGTTMVGIREYYEKDGEALPGKKGISMTVEQFEMVVRLVPEIERELKGRGLELGRPRYDRGTGEEDETKEEDDKKEGEEDDDDDDDEEEEDPDDIEGRVWR